MPAGVLLFLGVLIFAGFCSAFGLVCSGVLILEVAPLALIALCISYIILELAYRKCKSNPKNVDKFGTDNVKNMTKSLFSIAFVIEGITIALSVLSMFLLIGK